MWLSLTFRESSSILREPGEMNWLRSVASFLYIYYLVFRITESEGEPDKVGHHTFR